MDKIPVFSTIGEAYRFIFFNFRAFTAYALPGVIILALFGTVLIVTFVFVFGNLTDAGDQTGGADSSQQQQLLNLAVMLPLMLAYGVVFIFFSVVWHRVYLLPGAGGAVRDMFRWRSRHNHFFVAYFKIFGVTALIMLGFAAISVLTAGIGGVLMIPLLIGLAWLFAKLYILLPAAAVDRPLSIKDGMALTRGNGWRLFWIIFLAPIPVTLAMYIFMAIAGYGAATIASGSLTLGLVTTLLYVLVMFLYIAVTVTVLSVAYRFFAGDLDQAIVERFD